MAGVSLRDRLVTHSLQGRYTGMLQLGAFGTVVGAVLFAIALAGDGSHRAWQAFHWNWLFFTSLCGGSMAVVAVHKVAHAKWSGLLLRFAAAASGFIPISLLGLIAIFAVGYGDIYGHMQEQLHSLQHGKAVWLSFPFMVGRLAVGLGALFILGTMLVRADMVPDMYLARERAEGRQRTAFEGFSRGFDGSPEARSRQQARILRLAAGYIVVYALVFTIVAFDMVMALQPHWFSNLLGGFFFMAAFLGGHTMLALTSMYGERQLGIADLISPKQRHDLGKLCFGFTVFWAYLMWAQYLVIWYGNLPEETGFLFARLWGSWRPVGTWVFLGMFLIPFFGLLGVAPKKARVTLGLFAGISLFTLWVERYLLVIPSVTVEHGPPFGVPEVGATLLLGGLFLLSYARFARTYPMLSPRLAEVTLDREVHHWEAAAEFEHEEHDADYVSEGDIRRL